MTGRLYVSQLTVPAATPIAAPVSQKVPLDDINLDKVTVVIPSGHALLTGVAIFWSGVQIAPYITGTWLSGDDETIDFAYDDEITASGLQVVAYNTDAFPHSFLFRWFLSTIQAQTPVTIDSPQAATAPLPADVATIVNLTGTTDASAGLSADDLAALDMTGATS